MQVEAAVEAQRILAQYPRGVRLANGVAHDAIGFNILAADIDERGIGVNRHRGDHDALDRQMRIALHDLPVLEGTRLAFVGVDGEIARTAVGRGHERPLESGGEAGAAASAQPRVLDHRGDVLGFHRARFDHRLVAASLFIFFYSQALLAVGRQQIALDPFGNLRNRGRRRMRSDRGLRRCEHRGQIVRRHALDVGIAIDLDHRRGAARSEALDLDDCETAVSGRSAGLGAEPFFGLAHQSTRAVEAAWQSHADLDRGRGLGLIEQGIERGDFGHLAGAHAEMLSDFGEYFLAERPDFVAHHVQRIEQRPAGVGVMRYLRADFFVGRSR